MARLTDKQRKFIDEYLVDLNGTQAAIRAGYSEKTACATASENLRKPYIQTAIAERQKKLRDSTCITQEKVLEELAKIGFASITDLLEYKTVETPIELDGEEVIDHAPIIRMYDSNEVDASSIQEVSLSKDGTLKFKMYSKLDALDKIARHLGMYQDNLKIEGDIVSQSVEKLEDIKRQLKEG